MTAHYVYRCFGADGALLYVGATKDVTSRLNQHRLSSFWAGQVAKVRSVVYRDKDTAHEVERRAIFNESPKYNIRGKTNSRDDWTEQDFDAQIRTETGKGITHGSRARFEKLFTDYLARFGKPHPIETVIAPRLDAFDVRSAAAEKRRRELNAEWDRKFQEREAADNALHLEHCCSCRFGIVVDDELVEAYGNEFAPSAGLLPAPQDGQR